MGLISPSNDSSLRRIGFDSGRGQVIYLFATNSKLTLCLLQLSFFETLLKDIFLNLFISNQNYLDSIS
jgi:hypothetical protein